MKPEKCYPPCCSYAEPPSFQLEPTRPTLPHQPCSPPQAPSSRPDPPQPTTMPLAANAIAATMGTAEGSLKKLEH
jgi:hypothetical protein